MVSRTKKNLNTPSFLTIFEHSVKKKQNLVVIFSTKFWRFFFQEKCFKKISLYVSVASRQPSTPFSDALNIAKQYLWCPAQKKT